MKSMTINKAIAELQAAMSGPAGRHWNYGPAISAVLAALGQAEQRIAELEARIEPQEPIAWIVHARTGDRLTQNGDYVANAEGMCNIHSTPLYAAPSVQPVAVPDKWEQWIADAAEYLEGGLEADGELEAEGSIEAKRLLARRAAMLNQAHVKRPASNGQLFGNSEQLEPVADVVAWRKDGEQRTCDIRWRRFDVAPGPLFTRPLPPGLPDGYCIMPLKLTAANGAKAALSGEFHVNHHIVCKECAGEGCESCNEEGGWEGEILIGWDTIKRIHEAAVEACALPKAR